MTISRMLLTAHDVEQINKDYIASLTFKFLVELCEKLSTDLKEALDRLNQTPLNSSKPPSSQPPWNTPKPDQKDDTELREVLSEKDFLKEGSSAQEDGSNKNAPKEDESTGNKSEQEAPKTDTGTKNENNDDAEKKKSGKQHGAKGCGLKFGKNLEVSEEIIHRPESCHTCGYQFTKETKFTSYTARFEIDLVFLPSGAGLEAIKTKHTYDDAECTCGHINRSEPGRCEKEEGWTVEMTEWHMAGPMLVSFIVNLSKRQHMSRQHIHEFLLDWFSLHLCVGTINQCIHEAGRALSPVVENEIMDEVIQCALLYADETSWKEKNVALWLWVFSCSTATLFIVGRRTKKIAQKILAKFTGWLMSDGYHIYRDYDARLRCWAHLLRKAQGLAESLEQEAQNFGKETLKLFEALIEAIYQAREDSEPETICDMHQKELLVFYQLCEEHWYSEHEKTRALAREFIYDWTAIWRVLSNPSLPLTNNEAERALRHWVISRRISYGTRTVEGTAAFTAIASVIDTCYKRNTPPWKYIAKVVKLRRKGLAVPPLPAVA